MTSHDQRKLIAAYRAEFPDASYTRALNKVRDGWRPTPSAPRVYPGELGRATPPQDWTDYASRCPAIAAFWRDRDGDGDGTVDEITLYDGTTGERTGSLVVPHVPAEVYTRFSVQREAAGYLPGRRRGQQDELGWPNRLIHRLGHEAYTLCDQWQRWSDGSWRVPAEPLREQDTHSVTVTVLDDRAHLVRLVVTEHPDTVVLDEKVKVRWDPWGKGPYFVDVQRLLDQRGFAADARSFSDIGPGVEYGLAVEGRLPERHWLTRAKLRVLTTVTSRSPEGGDRKFTAGEVVTMERSGSAGHRIFTRSWASNPDVDVAAYLGPDDVELVEVIEHQPPTHAEAALDVETVTALLAPHHRGAAQAVEAWAAAGLHLSRGTTGLEIAVTSPRHRVIGEIEGDYWKIKDNIRPYSKPYTVIPHDCVDDHRGWQRELDALPLDPVAAAGLTPRTSPADWTLSAGASVFDRANLIEDLLWTHFPAPVIDEVLAEEQEIGHGLPNLVDECRPLFDSDDPHTAARVFAEAGLACADQAVLDQLLYGSGGTSQAIADLVARLYTPDAKDTVPF